MTIRLAVAEDREVVGRLLQLYLHDFSEFDGRDLEPDGSYRYPWFDAYWTDEDRRAYLIEVHGYPAGFALVRLTDPIEMAEFFIARKYRHDGVGSLAAHHIIVGNPGSWSISQLSSNAQATAFWRKAIPVPFEEHQLTDGSVEQRFEVTRETRAVSAEEQWVEVRPYDARWRELYRTEATAIRSTLGTFILGIRHFGSTAVPGMPSKPIVDILIGMNEGSSPDPAVVGLGQLGYEYLGEDGRRPGRHFWRKRNGDAFNVSVVPYLGAMWESNIAVREFLRTHPDWVERYGRAKLQAVHESGSSMLGYQDHKREFVDGLRSAALAWFREVGHDDC